MARSISEIKRTMTDAFMADETLREKYGLSASDTFSSSFSAVSLESILLHIVAACCHVLEVLLDRHRADVDERTGRAVVASVPWYYRMARAFQYGDALVFDEQTQQYVYAAPDESRQVVKYAAVRDRGTSVQILVACDRGGQPEPLSNAVLTAFKAYMNRVKIAGIVLSVRSQAADSLVIRATVSVDPLVIGTDGRSTADGTHPVEEAVSGYLRGIVYGGTFNKTKLVDAIQAVEGVADVELADCSYRAAGSADYTLIRGNNYTAAGGCFTAEGLQNSLVYMVQG